MNVKVTSSKDNNESIKSICRGSEALLAEGKEITR